MMNSKKPPTTATTDKTKEAAKETKEKTVKSQATTKDVTKPSTTTKPLATKTLKDVGPSVKDVTAKKADVVPKHNRTSSEGVGGKLVSESSKMNVTSKKESNTSTTPLKAKPRGLSKQKTITKESAKENPTKEFKHSDTTEFPIPTTVSDSDSSIHEINLEKEINVIPEEPEMKKDKVRVPSVTDSNASLNSTLADELKTQLNQKEQELSQMKRVIADKKDLLEQINLTRKERDDWHKRFEESDAVVNSCFKEMDDMAKQLTLATKLKEEADEKVKSYVNKITSLEKENEELKIKAENFELDFELKNEEYEGLKIELENANATIFDLSSQTKSNFNEIANLDEGSSTAKILELESNVSKLTTTLIKVSEDRNAEAIYYKKEIENLNDKIKVSGIKLEEIPKKEEEIKQLNAKVEDCQSTIEELKEKLEVVASASTMLEDLINEKTQLEIDYNRQQEEINDLKGEIETSDLYIQELENSSKISADQVRQKENELLEYNNKINNLKLKIEENDSKEKHLLSIVSDLKNQNKIIREEISKSNNVNIDEILNKNLNQSSKLKTLQRQKVLQSLSAIEISKLNLRNKIVNEMIPKKTFSKGYIESFDKFLLVQNLRRKTSSLILSILENDILADLNSAPSTESIEAENNKVFTDFLKSVLSTLIEFNNVLLSIEVLLSTFTADQFKAISDKKTIFMNVGAASHFIDSLVTLIKDDSFGVNYNFEGLKSLVKTLIEEKKDFLSELSIDNFEKSFPIVQYTLDCNHYLVSMLLHYKTVKANILTSNTGMDCRATNKLVEALYKQFKLTLEKIDEKFFSEIPYEASNRIFDLESTFFTKLQETAKTITEEEIGLHNFDNKFEGLFDVLSKSLVVAMSFLEKFEKDKRKAEEESENISQSHLPIPIWSEITSAIHSELESNLKIKDDLDEANVRVKQSKLEKVELESKYEDLARSKTFNEKKLAEMMVQAGKVSQLENEIEEQKKKIAKYNTTVDALRKDIELEQEKNNILKKKLENAPVQTVQNNRSIHEQRGSKRTGFLGMTKENPLGLRPSNSNNFMTDSVPLLNTICELQRERNFLKSKLMKDKLRDLLNQNSYVNRYINKDTSDNPEFYERVEENVQNLHTHYKETKRELCLPKIFDISEEGKETYEECKKKEENKVSKLRLDYMSEVDKILHVMFGDHTLDGTFKDMIDNDITRALKYYGEEKILVGKLTLADKERKQNEELKTVPLFVSEKSLKILNSTFMH